MLNSGSEYLKELEIEYKDKLICTDINLFNDNIIPVNEQQVSEMIEKVCNNTYPSKIEKTLPSNKNYDNTPD